MTTKKTTTKKSWRKPKLTVLVRGKPEEMVLATGCKTIHAAGPIVGNRTCKVPTACNATGS